jgi:hypothetical protein
MRTPPLLVALLRAAAVPLLIATASAAAAVALLEPALSLMASMVAKLLNGAQHVRTGLMRAGSVTAVK